MEQSLLDSSKYKIHSLSVDSRFADQYNKGTGDFVIRLPTAVKNVQRIALSSVEIPLVEYLFSSNHGNINFTVKVGAGPITQLTIAAGNYRDDQLAAEMATVLQAFNAGFLCSRSTTTGLVTITHATSAFQMTLVSDNSEIAERPTHWGLGYYLGFRSKATLSSTAGPAPYTLTGSTVILVQPTPYYLLQMECPDPVQSITHCTTMRTSIPAFAKLALHDNVYSIQFNNNSDYMRKEYTFLAPVNVTQLHVRLLDPYGSLVDMRAMDWSFTVELYEVVNSRTYAHLSSTFER
jgi:hypothetical protein